MGLDIKKENHKKSLIEEVQLEPVKQIDRLLRQNREALRLQALRTEARKDREEITLKKVSCLTKAV